MNPSELDESSDQTEGTHDKMIEGIYEFDWKTKWLKGDEYAHILQNLESYCKRFNFMKYSKKTHPECIYTDPQNGMIYFVEGNSVGSEFGFPRVEIKKRYRWKKMNFTTDLPKSRPFVTYIVASAVKCEKFFPNSKNEGPSFRMHAVILNKNGLSSYREKMNRKENGDSAFNNFNYNSDKEYILCHIRKIDNDYKLTKLQKPSNNEQNQCEDEKIDETREIPKTKKIKLENSSDISNNEPILNKIPENEENKEILKEKENEIMEVDKKNGSESLKFRKMNLNLFQMFCVNQVIDRDFNNLVNEFCKIPEKKKVALRKKNFFPEIIHEELNKKGENDERDYAKMFNLMS